MKTNTTTTTKRATVWSALLSRIFGLSEDQLYADAVRKLQAQPTTGTRCKCLSDFGEVAEVVIVNVRRYADGSTEVFVYQTLTGLSKWVSSNLLLP